MYKRSITLLFLSYFAISLTGQNGKKELVQAEKAVTAYLIQQDNRSLLHKAIHAIQVAEREIEGKALPKVWMMKGQVYERAAAETVRNLCTGEGEINILYWRREIGYEVFEAYHKCLREGIKNVQKKKVLEGLGSIQNSLLFLSVYQLEKGQKQKQKIIAAEHRTILRIHQLLLENGGKSALEGRMKWFHFQRALAAYYRTDLKLCADLSLQLYEQGYDIPSLYLLLYKTQAVLSSPGLGYPYLSEGRRRFPLDPSLIEGEVEYYFKYSQPELILQNLEERNKRAANNELLKIELGLFYNKLYKQFYADKDTTRAESYFAQSSVLFQELIDKNSRMDQAYLGMVTLYFDQLLLVIGEIMVLGEICSPGIFRALAEKRKEAHEIVAKASPYMKKLKSTFPNHLELLTIQIRFCGVEDQIESLGKRVRQALQAKMNPGNWHTYIVRRPFY